METITIKKWLDSVTPKPIGSGSGYGSDSGTGSGTGYGSGTGTGYGSDSGTGYGYDTGSGAMKIKQYNGQEVYYIDNIPCIFLAIVGGIAKVIVLSESDFGGKQMYIAKNENYFAHGDTIKESIAALRSKVMQGLDTEERIEKFTKTFKPNKKYKGALFFEWHNILTGSCIAGRTRFIEEHGLSLEKEYSVEEFIKICERDYGSDIIKMLKEEYKRSKNG